MHFLYNNPTSFLWLLCPWTQSSWNAVRNKNLTGILFIVWKWRRKNYARGKRQAAQFSVGHRQQSGCHCCRRHRRFVCYSHSFIYFSFLQRINNFNRHITTEILCSPSCFVSLISIFFFFSFRFDLFIILAFKMMHHLLWVLCRDFVFSCIFFCMSSAIIFNYSIFFAVALYFFPLCIFENLISIQMLTILKGFNGNTNTLT